MIVRYFLALTLLVLSTAEQFEEPPVLMTTPKVVFFRESTLFVLKCATAKQEKDIQYFWHKDGKPFDLKTISKVVQRKNDGTLVFFNPKHKDEGEYQCFAQSDAGIASTRTISVRRTYLIIPDITPIKHTPVKNRPFKLECPTPDSFPTPTAIWRQQHKLDQTFTVNVKDHLVQARDNSLYFPSVTQNDVSTNLKYVCLAVNTAVDEYVPVAQHFIQGLKEDTEPTDGELVPQYVDEYMTVLAGEIAIFFCVYGGTPDSYPVWYKNGHNLNSNPGDRMSILSKIGSKRLQINNVQPEDQGTYICVSDNGVGKPQNHSMQLNVVGDPRFHKKFPPYIVVEQGSNLTIPCQIHGNPLPDTSWTFNAKNVSSNDRLTIEKEELSAWKLNVNLTIKNIQKSDKGYYGCKSLNIYGYSYAETAVVVS